MTVDGYREYASIRIGNNITDDFVATASQLSKVHGIYFLYNLEGELIYVGKSVDLSIRILSTISGRGRCAVEFARTASKSDMSVYEKYYISKLKPLMNKEGKHDDELSLELPELKRTKRVIIHEGTAEFDASGYATNTKRTQTAAHR